MNNPIEIDKVYGNISGRGFFYQYGNAILEISEGCKDKFDLATQIYLWEKDFDIGNDDRSISDKFNNGMNIETKSVETNKSRTLRPVRIEIDKSRLKDVKLFFDKGGFRFEDSDGKFPINVSCNCNEVGKPFNESIKTLFFGDFEKDGENRPDKNGNELDAEFRFFFKFLEDTKSVFDVSVFLDFIDEFYEIYGLKIPLFVKDSCVDDFFKRCVGFKELYYVEDDGFYVDYILKLLNNPTDGNILALKSLVEEEYVEEFKEEKDISVIESELVVGESYYHKDGRILVYHCNGRVDNTYIFYEGDNPVIIHYLSEVEKKFFLNAYSRQRISKNSYDELVSNGNIISEPTLKDFKEGVLFIRDISEDGLVIDSRKEILEKSLVCNIKVFKSKVD